MRFGSGSPKRLSVPEGNPLLISRSNRGLFLSASASSLLLWNIKPQVVLAKLTRSERAIASQGNFAGILWKNDSSTVAVWTTKGVLLIFSVALVPGQDKALEFQFNKEFYYMSGPGDSRGTIPWELRLQAVLDTQKEITDGFHVGNHLFLTTKSGNLETRTWEGILVKSTPLQEFPFLSDNFAPGLYVSRTVSLITQSAVWVLSDGRAFLVTQGEQNGQKWIGFPCVIAPSPKGEIPKITAAGMNGKYAVLAVGLDDGTIKVFSLKNISEGLVQVHNFSLKNLKEYAQVASDVGMVTSLEWTADGMSLAVGWGSSGFAVWNLFGRLTACSITDIDLLANEEKVERIGAFDHGVLKVFWGPQGCELFILSRAPDGSNLLSVQPFSRPSSALNHTQDNLRHPAIVGENLLQLYIGQMTGVEISSPEVQYWRQIQLPPNYLSENWPISSVSCGGGGTLIGIAGRRGLAHFNVTTNKWKLFNNVQQEREFRCRGGMVWVGEVLVVACQDISTLTNSLRFYWQSSKLDRENTLLIKDLPSAVMHLEAIGDFLLVFTTDGIVREYKVAVSLQNIDPLANSPGPGSLKLTLLRDTQLYGLVHPYSVRSISWLTDGHGDLSNITSFPLVVLQAGVLYLVERTATEGPILHQLSQNVEQFFVAPLSKTVESLTTSIWMTDPEGIRIWLKDFLNTSAPNGGSTESEVVPVSRLNPSEYCTFRISLGFYPLTVLIDEGFLMGIGHDAHRRTFFEQSVVSFRTLNENYLFLPNILGYLLRRSEGPEAILFGKAYKEYMYFGHALEVLLHEALEDQIETPAGVAILQKVIQFIEQFPQFLDVVMSVARKTEADTWNYFFTFAGDPQELFEMSLETGRLRTACSYLSIIHNMEDKSVSRKAASRLLETSLYTEDFDIAQEIVEFMRKLDAFAGSETENGSQIFLDILLSRHARLLLQNYRIRALGDFSRKLNFPLNQWLQRESHRAGVVADVAGAFEALHQQFNWPYPADEGALEKIRVRLSQMKPSTTQQKTREEEIWVLLEAMKQAHCVDWMVLLGFMVGDYKGPAMVFRSDVNRYEEFSKVIEDTKSAGYQILAKKVAICMSKLGSEEVIE